MLSLALVSLLSLSPVQAHGADPPPFDVLLVVGDDLHWKDVAATPTPSLDWLAERGMVMRNHHSTPLCSPTRHELLHGRYPRRSGMGSSIDFFGDDHPHPDSDLVSLPKLLKARGFRTCLVGKWHLGEADWSGDAARCGLQLRAYGPHAAGFDHWLAGSPANVFPAGTGYSDWVRVDDGVVRQEYAYCTRVMTEEACRWWQETEGPKFMEVCLQAPHQPFHAPPPELVPGWSGPPSNNTQRYLQMLGTVDWSLGELLKQVDLERTYVVFVSDNGTPPLVNGSGTRAKGTTLGRGVNVPLIVAGPKIRPGTSDALVLSLDLPATLLELATGAGPALLAEGRGFEDAVSFAGALLGRRFVPNERTWLTSEKYDQVADDFMIRDKRWKLRRFESAGFGGQHESLLELYDLQLDPDERAPMNVRGLLGAEQRAAADRLAALAETLPPRRDP